MVNPSDSVNDLKNIPTKEPVLAGVERGSANFRRDSGS